MGVPDTLQGRFEMVALHLFPLLYRLMHEPGDDPELARLVSESFVADMDAAFREMGVGDLTVPKRMNTLYRSFAGRISAYSGALRDGEGALAAAIDRNVFPDRSADRQALFLAQHAQAAVAALRAANLDALRRGEAPFPAPPAPHREEPLR
jgi:cytochrome b pre-mRNA-processing protein 3